MSKIVLTPEQQVVKDHVVSNKGITLVAAKAGTGKEQPLTSKILTPSGWTTMGEIRVGDEVCTPTKGTNKVLAIHPQGIKDVYKVTFSDGTSAECGLNHLWKVGTSYYRPKGVNKLLTTKELLGYGLKTPNQGFRFHVPLTEVEFPTRELPLAPYLLGALIADGSLHKQVCLSSHVDDVYIVEKCIKLLPEGTSVGPLRATSKNGIQRTFKHTENKKGDHSLKVLLKRLGLQGAYSHEKFIPDMYKFSDYDQRVSLLRGLMDCDGSVGARNRVSYSTTSKRLMSDISDLVMSLGGLVKVSVDIRVGRRDCYSVCVKFDALNPFSLKRKMEKVTARKQNSVRKAVAYIEKLEVPVEQQCISVTGDNLYITDEFITTHNSFMARQLVKVLQPKKVLYTAFNKAIVVEASELFPSNVQCKTLHALAYKYTQPSADIHPLNYKEFPKHLPYRTKYLVKEALEVFFVSASTDMWDFFEDYFDEPELPAVAVGIVERMLAKDMSWSFGFMLKYFHLMLSEDPSVCKYDLVILDEINDTTAVALEIFKLIEAPKKVGLGDPYQAIYAFLNLADGFEELKDSPVLPLTHSFRCSKEIASKIENFMREDLCEDFTFEGTDTPVANGLTLYCTLTNSEIIQNVCSRLDSGKSFKLLRKPVDIFACALAVLSASGGKKVFQTQYKFLEDVYEDWITKRKEQPNLKFFKYVLAELQDPEIHGAVRLIASLNNEGKNLFEIYDRVKKHKQKGNYIASTVFTSKGLEMENVILSDEFNRAIDKIRESGGVRTPQHITTYRCAYVAASRAGINLHNANFLEEQTWNT